MIKITDNHAQRLQKMAPFRIVPAIGQELSAAAKAVEDTMRNNMNDGAISGSRHVPGPPYGSAKSDTHEMEQSIHVGEVIETPTEIRTAVIAGGDEAPYAIYVELGHSNALPRPGLSLAVQEVRPTVMDAIEGRFREEVMR